MLLKKVFIYCISKRNRHCTLKHSNYTDTWTACNISDLNAFSSGTFIMLAIFKNVQNNHWFCAHFWVRMVLSIKSSVLLVKQWIIFENKHDKMVWSHFLCGVTKYKHGNGKQQRNIQCYKSCDTVKNPESNSHRISKMTQRWIIFENLDKFSVISTLILQFQSVPFTFMFRSPRPSGSSASSSGSVFLGRSSIHTAERRRPETEFPAQTLLWPQGRPAPTAHVAAGTGTIPPSPQVTLRASAALVHCTGRDQPDKSSNGERMRMLNWWDNVSGHH